MHKTMPDEQRFWSKYIPEPNSGCWLWLGTLSNNGYGTDAVGSNTDGTRRQSTSHRLACEFAHGAAPSVEHQALHKCDVKLCINPAHLYWGTRKDNGRDASERGKTGGKPMPGEQNGRARLSAEDVGEILSSDESGAELGRRYGVSRTHISHIRSGKSWGHLHGA